METGCRFSEHPWLIRDPNVQKLVRSWFGHTLDGMEVSGLDVSLRKFLLLRDDDLARYGDEFRRQHRELIRNILTQYASSVNLIQMAADSYGGVCVYEDDEISAASYERLNLGRVYLADKHLDSGRCNAARSGECLNLEQVCDDDERLDSERCYAGEFTGTNWHKQHKM